MARNTYSHLRSTKRVLVMVDTACIDCGGTGLRVEGGSISATIHVCRCVRMGACYGASRSHEAKHVHPEDVQDTNLEGLDKA